MTGQPRKIVHCVRAPIGGIFRHIADLALEQTRQGHQVGIVCDSTSGGTFEAQHIEQLSPHLAFGVARFPMARRLTPSDIVSTWRLYSHIKAIQPDILHGHGAKGGAFARMTGSYLRAKGYNVKRIYCPHGGSLHYDPKSLKGTVFFALERFLGRLSDGLVFVCDYERDRYFSSVGAPSSPYKVAYNGLRKEEFEPVELAADAADFSCIGMQRDLKGMDLFIQAIATLAKEGADIRANLIGDGPDHQRYRRMVHDLNLTRHVQFLDPMPIRKAFTLSKCVVVPSRAEAMPYIVLETIAAGRPIIATNVGGIPEILAQHDPALIAADNQEALTAALRDFILHRQERAELSLDRKTRIATKFSVNTMSQTISAFYDELIEPGKDPVQPQNRKAIPAAGALSSENGN
ncbi:MAG: glycosyltransferase family 4 protein [Stappiaceae bacterium]